MFTRQAEEGEEPRKAGRNGAKCCANSTLLRRAYNCYTQRARGTGLKRRTILRAVAQPRVRSYDVNQRQGSVIERGGVAALRGTTGAARQRRVVAAHVALLTAKVLRIQRYTPGGSARQNLRRHHQRVAVAHARGASARERQRMRRGAAAVHGSALLRGAAGVR